MSQGFRLGPWLLWIVVTAMGVTSLIIVPLDAPAENLGFVIVSIVMSGVGALILSKLPGNRIGVIFFLIGAFPLVGYLGGSYAELVLVHHVDLPGAVPVVMATGFWFPAMFMLLSFLFLLFPTGRYASRRWRRGGRLAVAAFILGLPHLFEPGLLEEYPVANPLGIDVLGPYFNTYSNLWFLVMSLGVLTAVVSMVQRFRRSRGEERQQLKWLGYAAGAIGLLMLVDGMLLDTVLGIDSGVVGDLLFSASFLFIPMGAGIAILRYRLFDIDVVINKTLVYGAMAAFITAVYVGVVVGIGASIGSGGEPNLGLSLAATAIVALAFQPVRQRVQRFANKLVYGERITPYEAVTLFSHRIAGSLSFDQVLPQMAEAAAKGVGGSRSRVQLFLPGGDRETVTWPSDSSDNSFDRTVTVVHQGEDVGSISIAKPAAEQVSKAEERLLADLASQAGLAMRNLRLTAELQKRLEELQESRKRIVATADAERRRMERDIHDGAQQQLVAMAVKLGLAKSLARKDPAAAAQALEALRKDTDEVVESVRDLARGIYPAVLVDRGLGPALESHVNKTKMTVSISDETGGERFPREVEAAAYFTIREALQNAAKHAGDAPIAINLSISSEMLKFSVDDQGPGFDMGRVRLGSGLENMRDRIEAVGGGFRIRSGPGKGTSMEGRIPSRVLEVVH